MATSKERLGREKMVYTLQEIQSLYLEDLSAICNTPISYSAWKPAEPKPKAVAADAVLPPHMPLMLSLDQDKDPQYLASRAGFQLGHIVFEKEGGSSPASKLVYITSIGQHIGLAQVCTYVGEQVIVQAELSTFLRHWAVFKGEAPIRMIEGQKRPQSLQVDMMRATLFNVVLSADVQNKVALEGLQFYMKLDEVRANMSINHGQLQLFFQLHI